MKNYISHETTPDGVRTDETFDTIGLACERTARMAWRAVCNGRGMVDTKTRKVFNGARKAVGDPDSTGTVVDAIASALERTVNRTGSASLSVDGSTYGVLRND